MSEWLCARIAHAVGLPVPECFIAKLAPECFKAWRACNPGDYPTIVTDANPYVFASKNVESAKDVINVESDLGNVDIALLAKIYAFDAFVRNADRTDYNSNLLINYGVHVIDHNNAFDVAFDPVRFAGDHLLRSYYERASTSDLAAFGQKLRDTVTTSFLESVWSEMPAEWTDAGEVVFSLGEVKNVLLGSAG